MKGRVTRLLNIRTGAPLILPNNNPGFLKPNDVVEIIDTVVGDTYKENNVWYKLSDGSFVWSGGVERNTTSPLRLNKDWWFDQYKIEMMWERFATRGEGVTVAVIDSGVDLSHPNLFNQRHAQGKDYSNTSFKTDAFGHGTLVAGVLCADGDQLTGVAPDSTLYVVKVFDTGGITYQGILKALEELPPAVDIVVLSQGLLRATSEEALDEKIDSIASSKLIVCSAGNFGNHLDDSPTNFYPATLPNCISVSACDLNDNIFMRSAKSERIDICGPGVNMRLINPANHALAMLGSGTSYAAPFIAGILCLMKSFVKKTGKAKSNGDLVKILKESVKDNSKNPLLFGSGIINTEKIIQKLL